MKCTEGHGGQASEKGINGQSRGQAKLSTQRSRGVDRIGAGRGVRVNKSLVRGLLTGQPPPRNKAQQTGEHGSVNYYVWSLHAHLQHCVERAWQVHVGLAAARTGWMAAAQHRRAGQQATARMPDPLPACLPETARSLPSCQGRCLSFIAAVGGVDGVRDGTARLHHAASNAAANLVSPHAGQHAAGCANASLGHVQGGHLLA